MTAGGRCPRVVVTLLLAGAAGCGGDGGGVGPIPVPGTLEVTLTSPNPDDAAILFRVMGPGLSQISAADGEDYLRVIQDGNTLTVVLVGDLPSGGLIRFNVPDVAALGSYSAVVLQVADDANMLRGSLAGYALVLAESGP